MNTNKRLESLGSALGFSAAVYKNATDKKNSLLAKEVATNFAEFASSCQELDLSLASGFDEFEGVGMCGYVAVKAPDNTLLFVALTPHQLIDVEDPGEDE